MAIPLNDNISIQANKLIDDRHKKPDGTPYTSKAEVLLNLIESRRTTGLIVLIGQDYYYFKSGITLESHLQPLGGITDAVLSVSGNLVNNSDPKNPTIIFNPFNYDLSDFNNLSPNPFVRKNALDNYVIKIPTKGLSTNDYTTGEKDKLNSIQYAAQVNKIESIKLNGVTLPIDGLKTVNIIGEDITQDNGIKPIYIQFPELLTFGESVATYFNNLPNFTVSEVEIMLVITSQDTTVGVTTTTEINKYLIKYKGKGNYGNGGTPLVLEDFELIYRSGATVSDITDNPTTQTINLGDITGQTVSNKVNSLSPSVLIQEQGNGYRVFTTVQSGESVNYLFTAVGGTYGSSGLQTSPSDFEIFGNNTNLEATLTEDVITQFPTGTTLGAVGSGVLFPENMTFTQFVKKVSQKALEPTINLASTTTIKFNQTAISNILNFSYIINTTGASVASVKLEFRRKPSDSWVTLTTNTALNTYTHSLTDIANNPDEFYYNYTVVDSAGGIKSKTVTIDTEAYVAPEITFSVGAVTREKGNIETNITGTIVKKTDLVNLTSYQIQVNVNGGGWNNLGAVETITSSPKNISYNHNDIALVDAENIAYRIVVLDTYQSTTSATKTVAFVYKAVLGYNLNTTLTLAEILALDNPLLTNAKSRIVDPVTAGVGLYTYIAYKSLAGDLTEINQGVAPVFGAFTKLTDVTGTNTFGANVTYRVYKSNSTNAFTNQKLTLI